VPLGGVRKLICLALKPKNCSGRPHAARPILFWSSISVSSLHAILQKSDVETDGRTVA
jgi:hypothetical protein